MNNNHLSFFGKAHRIDIIIIAIAVILVVVAIALFAYRTKDDTLTVAVNGDIDDTPTLLTEIREIGQWEFLTISDEEMIDTVRKGFFSDDELTRIYYGTLRLGIDFSKADSTWFVQDGDSVRLNIPQAALLDENFLDEARSQSFIEKGTWTNADRKALAERARQTMRARCLTQQNLQLAQQNANEQVKLFLMKVMKK